MRTPRPPSKRFEEDVFQTGLPNHSTQTCPHKGESLMRSLQQFAAKGGSAMLVLLLALVLIPSAALAQTETGQLTGTVQDPSGGVIAGATVTVKGVDTGFERSSTTTGSGAFTISNLQPGTYDVTVKASGF